MGAAPLLSHIYYLFPLIIYLFILPTWFTRHVHIFSVLFEAAVTDRMMYGNGCSRT